VYPQIFLLHKVVRDAKKVEKHCLNVFLLGKKMRIYVFGKKNM